MAFRTPTLLKSTDLQWGQRAESTLWLSSHGQNLILWWKLPVSFCRAASGRGKAIPEGPAGGRDLRLVAASVRNLARFPCRFNLFRRSDVWFGQFYFVLRASHLALVPLR